MSKYYRPLILVIVLALTVMACGDDDFGGDFGGDQGTNVPGFGDDGFGDGDATLPTSVGDIPGVSDECEAYFDLSFAMSAAFTGDFDGLAGDLLAKLPAAAQADGAIIAGALQDFVDGIAAAGIDLSQGVGSLSQEQLQAFGEIGDSVFTEEVNDAFDRIGELAAENCAIAEDF